MESSNRNFYVAGNFIAEQHVDLQILHADKVYSTPQTPQTTAKPKVILVEDILTPTTSSASHKTKVRRTTSAITEATFTYRYWNKLPNAITNLYQCLLKAKWIAPDTKPDDFCAIFEGQPSTVRVKWINKQAYLFYLIRQMVDRQIITMSPSATIWQITESHFIDKNSRPFHDFNKQHTPKTAIPAIEELLKILQPSA